MSEAKSQLSNLSRLSGFRNEKVINIQTPFFALDLPLVRFKMAHWSPEFSISDHLQGNTVSLPTERKGIE